MKELIERQRVFSHGGATRPLEHRLETLSRLRRAIESHEGEILQALELDLGKSGIEAYVSEIAMVLGDIRHAMSRLRGWIRPRSVGTPWMLMPGSSRIIPEPRGVVAILGAWNYPFQLLLSPCVSALAAGNAVVLKPSEHAPATAGVIARMIRGAFDDAQLAVVEGDHETAQRLLENRFDKIFFTGGAKAGRLVMAAAAKHLTPVTLELGGKCPCVVTADADLEVAARRIVWGKFMNAGQTCIAPDHVWVDARVAARLIEAMKRALLEFYGDDPRLSRDYGRIIHHGHFDRLAGYLDAGRIEIGGVCDREARYIAPTILSGVTPDMQIMQEEIFGPILPVLEYRSVDALLDQLGTQPEPLAFYLFCNDREMCRRFIRSTRSGGVCVNDTLGHVLNRNLPFGGLGESGIGTCHGKAGFDAFSHHRSVLTRTLWPDFRFRYPPLEISLKTIKRLLRWIHEI